MELGSAAAGEGPNVYIMDVLMRQVYGRFY